MLPDQFKVCVRCLTYNHSPYIEDTLQGFVSQQTTFPFLFVVVDDASSDDNAIVINRFLQNNFDPIGDYGYVVEENDNAIISEGRSKANSNCFFVFYSLKFNHHRKGIDKEKYFEKWMDVPFQAICEGDDYWIDQKKLQKQVDLMEEDTQVGLCYTDAKVYYQTEKRFGKSGDVEFKGLRDMFKNNPIMTLTTMFKTDLLYEYCKDIQPSTKDWLSGDYPFWLWLAAHSKVKFINEITSVYRYLDNSASHSTDINKQIAMYISDYDIKSYFIDRIFPDDIGLKNFIEDRKNLRIAGVYDKFYDRKNYVKYSKMIKNRSVKDSFKLLLLSFPPVYYIRKHFKQK